jgi:outer membrane receptor protein involved in Fe transport
VAIAIVAAAGICTSQAQVQGQKFDLSVPPNTLIEALKLLRTQTESQIVYSPQQLDGARTAGLSGSFTVLEALTELLKQTSFTFKINGQGTIVVEPATAPNAVIEPIPPATPLRAAPTPIEEITVTAEKREEAAKDVPESVSALTGSTLSQLGLNDIDDYGTYVPGLVLLSNQRGFGQVVLRGITTGTTQPTASVGTYIDDVPYGSSTAFAGGNLVIADIDPFDIQRIEIDRGPQGTLYGAGTLAGLLKYVTTPPKLGISESEGEVDGGGTEGGGLDEATKILTNVPLGDRAALRLDLYQRRDSGYIDDIGTGNKDENFSEVRGGRISLLVQPDSDLSIRFLSLYQERHVGGTPAVDVNPETLQPVFGDLEQSREVRETASQQYQLHDINVSWDLGPAALTSSTSYSRSIAHAETDDSAALGPVVQTLSDELFQFLPNTPAIALPNSFTTSKFTEEVRLASPQNHSLEWLVGSFYTYEWSNARESLEATLPNVTLPAAVAQPFAEEEPSRFREFAGFGDLDYYFTPTIDVTAGARWSRNRQSFDQTASGLLNNIVDPGQLSSNLGASAGSSWTFRLAPRWRITDEVTAYAEASSGYRPGGPNVPRPNTLISSGQSPDGFAADTLINYEFGLKSEMFDKRLSFDADAFLINWRNIQLQTVTSGFAVEANGGSATSRGVEYEASYHPLDGVILSLSGAYIDAVLNSNAPIIGGLRGNALPTVPRWSGAATIDYTFPAIGAVDGAVGASYRLVGTRDTSFDQDIETPNLHLPAYGEVDLRAGLAVDDSTINLFVDNLLNERGAVDIQESVATPGSPARLAVIRPLAVGLQITTRF